VLSVAAVFNVEWYYDCRIFNWEELEIRPWASPDNSPEFAWRGRGRPPNIKRTGEPDASWAQVRTPTAVPAGVVRQCQRTGFGRPVV
jgi:hypothetical protein